MKNSPLNSHFRASADKLKTAHVPQKPYSSIGIFKVLYGASPPYYEALNAVTIGFLLGCLIGGERDILAMVAPRL